MYLSIRLDDDSVELMQSDIEDMWNYLDRIRKILCIIQPRT